MKLEIPTSTSAVHWHVTVKRKGDSKSKSLLDLTFQDLGTKILNPWHDGRPFSVSGLIIRKDAADLDEFRICWTPKPYGSYRESFHNRQAEGNRNSNVICSFFYREQWIFKEHDAKDYTTEFLFPAVVKTSRGLTAWLKREHLKAVWKDSVGSKLIAQAITRGWVKWTLEAQAFRPSVLAQPWAWGESVVFWRPG